MIETEGRIEPESMGVIFHKPEEFEGMRKAGRLAAKVLDFITPHVVPGISTAELDTLCHNFIIDHSARPAPLNYKGFRNQFAHQLTMSSATEYPTQRKFLRMETF